MFPPSRPEKKTVPPSTRTFLSRVRVKVRVRVRFRIRIRVRVRVIERL